MSTTDERKFAFLGSKNLEIRKAMINFFIKLGATNRQKLLGGSELMYYFIDKTNKIYNNDVKRKKSTKTHNCCTFPQADCSRFPEKVGINK